MCTFVFQSTHQTIVHTMQVRKRISDYGYCLNVNDSEGNYLKTVLKSSRWRRRP